MAGIDHSMAGIDIRQRFSLAKSRQQQILQALFHMEMVEGAVLLSTCNRTEIYLSCREGFSPDPFALFCQAANLPFEDCQGLYKVRRGEECFDHLCLLGSGALSQIWGEDQIITQVKNGQFSPCIVYENDVPAEYAALKLTSYPEANRKDYAEISSLLEDYYAEKNKITRIRQRSS